MEWYFAADVKYTLTRAMISVVVQQLRRHFEKGIIVTRYVTPQVAELLKEADIPFLDAAANMLTKHLKPQNITVYMTNFKAGFRFLLIVNRLQRDPEGDIEIIETFWNFEHEWQYDCIVHPILIYADLLATGDARNIETAEMIYEQELTRFIRED